MDIYTGNSRDWYFLEKKIDQSNMADIDKANLKKFITDINANADKMSRILDNIESNMKLMNSLKTVEDIKPLY